VKRLTEFLILKIISVKKIGEFILGYNAGNTAAAFGDPYSGDQCAIVDGGRCVPMHPKDWIKICKLMGRKSYPPE
jgi:hypothetical protein